MKKKIGLYNERRVFYASGPERCTRTSMQVGKLNPYFLTLNYHKAPSRCLRILWSRGRVPVQFRGRYACMIGTQIMQRFDFSVCRKPSQRAHREPETETATKVWALAPAPATAAFPFRKDCGRLESTETKHNPHYRFFAPDNESITKGFFE